MKDKTNPTAMKWRVLNSKIEDSHTQTRERERENMKKTYPQ